MHTASLVVMGYEDADDDTDEKSPTAHGAKSGSESKEKSRQNRSATNADDQELSTMRSRQPHGASTGTENGDQGANGSRRMLQSQSSDTTAFSTPTQTQSRDGRSADEGANSPPKPKRSTSEVKRNQREVPISVIEQRVSNLAQGCFCM